MARALASLLLFAATSVAGEDLSVRVLPAQPLVEAAKGSRELNCDFLFEKPSPDAYTLVEVRVSVLDGGGRLATERFVGLNGLPAGIETVPGRTLPPKGALLVFNPLHSFDEALPLDRLRFEFDLESGEGPEAKQRTLSLEIAPQLYRTKTALRLPLKGRVLVHDGHDFYAHHRRSGDSFLPHIHYQLQAGPGLFAAEGLPSSFTGLKRVLGAKLVGWPSGAIDSGDLVEAP